MSAFSLAAGGVKVTDVICDVCKYKEQYLGIGIGAARSDLKRIGWRYTKPNHDTCTACVNKEVKDESST